jgi:hypothetical protein
MLLDHQTLLKHLSGYVILLDVQQIKQMELALAQLPIHILLPMFQHNILVHLDTHIQQTYPVTMVLVEAYHVGDAAVQDMEDVAVKAQLLH